MARFVVLRHEVSSTSSPDGASAEMGAARRSHWDWMFEVDGQLRTWAVAEELVDGKTVVAEPLADHRLAYLDYEGPISGDRGYVRRVDEGQYEVLTVDRRTWRVRLQGRQAQGVLAVWESSDSIWLATLAKEARRDCSH